MGGEYRRPPETSTWEQRSVQLLVGIDHLAGEKARRNPCRPGAAESLAQAAVACDTEERGCQRRRVPRGDQQPGPFVHDRVGETADGTADHRAPGRHCLEGGDSHSLASRWQNEDVAAGEKVADVGAGAEEANSIPETEAIAVGLEGGPPGALAGDPDLRNDARPAHLAERIEEDVDALAVNEGSERQKDTGVIDHAQAGASCDASAHGRDAVGIDRFMDEVDAVAGNAAGSEAVGDGRRDGNCRPGETPIDGGRLVAAPDAAFHATGGDRRNAGPPGGGAAEHVGTAGMQVHQAGFAVAEHSEDAAHRGQIGIAAHRDFGDINATTPCFARRFAAGRTDQHHPVAAPAEPLEQQKDLHFAAGKAMLGVDVGNARQNGAREREAACRRSAGRSHGECLPEPATRMPSRTRDPPDIACRIAATGSCGLRGCRPRDPTNRPQAAREGERRMRKATCFVILVGWLTGTAAARETIPTVRSFDRFEQDAAVADGLWSELIVACTAVDESGLEVDQVATARRAAWGFDLFEAGLTLPFLHREASFESLSAEGGGVGDIRMFGKVVPLRNEIGSIGAGVAMSVPSGDEDQGLGTGEVGLSSETRDWGIGGSIVCTFSPGGV